MRIDQPRTLIEKLNILSDAAKYDVACTSSGTELHCSRDLSFLFCGWQMHFASEDSHDERLCI